MAQYKIRKKANGKYWVYKKLNMQHVAGIGSEEMTFKEALSFKFRQIHKDNEDTKLG